MLFVAIVRFFPIQVQYLQSIILRTKSTVDDVQCTNVHTGYCIQTDVYISCLKWIETLCIIQNNTKTMRKQWLNKWKCNAKATEILSRKLKLKKNAKIYPLNDYLHQKIGYKNINWQAFTKHTESYGIHTARMAAAFLRLTRTRIKAHTQKRIAFQILCALNRLVFFLL